ncbi:MAG: hypothetical protein ACLGHZ_03480 [Actinomycetes bacterium]
MNSFAFPDFPEQKGLATTRQLVDAGATDAILRRLARTGHRAHRTVYAREAGSVPEASRLTAGWLWAGPRSVLTGVHALVLHGLAVERTPPLVPFLVPDTCRTRQRASGIVTVRTKRLPNASVREGVPVASIERALVDAQRLRELTDRELKGCTLAILQERRSTPDRVAVELELGRRTGTGGIVAGINGFRQGAWSAPEALLAGGVRECADLPAMLANRRLTVNGRPIGIPDGFFPDAGVVVQVHSKRHHSGLDKNGGDRWGETMQRDVGYAKHNIVVVPVAPATLIDDLDGFVADLVDVVRPRMGWTSDVVEW